MKNNLELKIGDSVVIKKGVLDPDSGQLIDGWQGRIQGFEKTEEGETHILIALDSITLKNIAMSYFEESEEKGLDWRTYYLEPEDVELVKARDTHKDVEKTVDEIEEQVSWCSMGEEGKRIKKILAGVDADDDVEALEVWEEILEKTLVFPLEAEVSEYQERGPLKDSDKVTILDISGTDEMYGVIVTIKHKSRKHEFPLCDLKVIGKDSTIKEIVSDYAVWFANR